MDINMTNSNDFFYLDDPNTRDFEGFNLHPEWWSRHYEYPWAYTFTAEGSRVADMGCGWSYRPFKDALAKRCKTVFAVDRDQRLVDLIPGSPRNIIYLVSDIQKVERIAPFSLDTIFCISVFEDLEEKVEIQRNALTEFARLLKPNGRIVLTFDVPYDDSRPTEPYPGVDLVEFAAMVNTHPYVYSSGPWFVAKDKDLLVHEQWNLCVYHCVLKRRNPDWP
jgi:SAM-dependent methyltransferase